MKGFGFTCIVSGTGDYDVLLHANINCFVLIGPLAEYCGQCCVLKFEIDLLDLVDWISLSCRSESSKFVSEEGFEEG